VNHQREALATYEPPEQGGVMDSARTAIHFRV
jgi:hypothetical protein